MFESEVTLENEGNVDKPTASGFYALILEKIIDEDFAQSITLSPKTLKK